MFLQNIFFLKPPSLSLLPSYRRHDQLTLLLFGGVILVLLFTLMTFAIAPLELFGEDDIPFLESVMTSRMVRDLFSGANILGFELGVCLSIVWLEHLRGHIGEKRFAERMVRPYGLFGFAFFKTASYGAVFPLIFIHSA